MTLPKRTADTMSEAIAQSSPSGSTSKAAKNRADERLRRSLFGDGLPFPSCPQPTRKEYLKRRIKDLREMANRGITPRKLRKEANKLAMEIKSDG